MTPAIDDLVLTVGGRKGTLRQHAIWVTGMGLNYIEEQALNEIAKKVEDHRLLKVDLEKLLYSWGMSSGKKAVRYIVVSVENIADARKTTTANARKATSNPAADDGDQMVFSDKEEAARFVAYLKENGIHGWVRPFGSDKVTVGALNVHELYKTYFKAGRAYHTDATYPGGDPRPASQPPDSANARLACPNADASQLFEGSSTPGSKEQS